jgi:hypothetical protein
MNAPLLRDAFPDVAVKPTHRLTRGLDTSTGLMIHWNDAAVDDCVAKLKEAFQPDEKVPVILTKRTPLRCVHEPVEESIDRGRSDLSDVVQYVIDESQSRRIGSVPRTSKRNRTRSLGIHAWAA